MQIDNDTGSVALLMVPQVSAAQSESIYKTTAQNLFFSLTGSVVTFLVKPEPLKFKTVTWVPGTMLPTFANP